nr:MAG TPA: tail collar fiber protein [Caudoviricetes sp.]
MGKQHRRRRRLDIRRKRRSAAPTDCRFRRQTPKQRHARRYPPPVPRFAAGRNRHHRARLLPELERHGQIRRHLPLWRRSGRLGEIRRYRPPPRFQPPGRAAARHPRANRPPALRTGLHRFPQHAAQMERRNHIRRHIQLRSSLMTNFTEQNVFTAGVRMIEPGDSVIGGVNAPVNLPFQALANRTLWLKTELATAVQSIGSLQSISITAGAGLAGGGSLSANRSLTLATPSTLSGSTSNWAGNGSTGHTHELAKATATLAGVVKLVDNLTAGGRDAALSAEQGKILKKDIEGKVAQAAPSGQIAFFAGSSAPAGWLKANGAAVSRALYAALFAAIGTTYGAGDGSTTFNLPDLRGEFMRGWDDGRGIDRGRAFGSAQGDAIRNITGEAKFGYDGDTVYDHNAAASTSAIYYPNRKVQDTVNNMSLFSNAANNWRPLVFDASRAVPTADENRPRNIALLACIKI